MKPKISVAMTTYNGRAFLREQLDSILAQSRQVDELVVCDDGSADDTVGILEEFAAAAPFPVRVAVNERNLGSTKNFEKAMSLCIGDIIALCDQDDVWLPRKIEILENTFLANDGCGMVFTDAMAVDEANNPQGKLWAWFKFDKKKQKMLRRGDGLRLFVAGNVVTGATAAITKSFFEEAAPFPDRFVHDRWLAIVAVSKGKLFFSDAVTINYRRHASQQLGAPAAKNFFQRAGGVFDYGSAVREMKFLREELDAKVHLTGEQHKEFADVMEFYLFRKDIPSGGWLRVPKVVGRLCAGKYHKYAFGFLSAAKDIIRKS